MSDLTKLEPKLQKLKLADWVYYENTPLFDKNERNPRFILLGEILQMPGHVVVIRMHDQKIFAGFHDDNFEVCGDDE